MPLVEKALEWEIQPELSDWCQRIQESKGFKTIFNFQPPDEEF